LQIRERREIFNNLAKILDIPTEHNNSLSFARMLQFVALKHRCQKEELDFQKLLKRIRDWVPPYQNIIGLRKEYSSHEYTLPKEFKDPIPALEIYEKYKQYL